MAEFEYHEKTVIKAVKLQGMRFCAATDRGYHRFDLDLRFGRGDNPEVCVLFCFGNGETESRVNFDLCLPMSAIPDVEVSSKAIVEILSMDRSEAVNDLLSWIVAKNAKLLVKLVGEDRVCFTLTIGKTTLKQEVSLSKVNGFLERIPADS